ncbi:cytochrome P450 [Actinomycetospora sp. CA-101289]|uniref:cytochrome P450 n=1 Tax=Actinomycetospora sp. CA-101289 TaxID=3239893 RepID=UPI003D97344D
MATPDDLTAVDVMDRAHHVAGPPHALFSRLRSACPAHAVTGPDGERFWSLTRDEDVVAVSRDTETFSNHRGGIFLHPDQVAPLDFLRQVLLFKDPPEHRKYRKILASVFTPKAIAGMEDSVRATVTDVVDQVVGAGRCDVVRDIAVPVPLRVLAGIMGLPAEDVDRLYDWTHQIERAQQSDEPAGATQVFGEMVGYLHQQIERQMAEGGDSLVTRLKAAEVDGESLAPEEILTFFGLLVFAGNDTTRNTAATGTLALLQHAQWGALHDDPSLAPRAVEEVLRWTSVVKYFARTATQDTEVAGQRIAEGEKVVTWFTSASRDGDLNKDPDRFDITREKVQHRAFGGGGPHLCLGNQLARLELRVLFEELPRRMPDLALDGEPEYLASNWAHALTALPVRFAPERA